VWDALSGEVVRELQGHRATINVLSFSPEGSLLASGSSGDGKLMVWSVTATAVAGTIAACIQDGAGHALTQRTADGEALTASEILRQISMAVNNLDRKELPAYVRNVALLHPFDAGQQSRAGRQRVLTHVAQSVRGVTTVSHLFGEAYRCARKQKGLPPLALPVYWHIGYARAQEVAAFEWACKQSNRVFSVAMLRTFAKNLAFEKRVRDLQQLGVDFRGNFMVAEISKVVCPRHTPPSPPLAFDPANRSTP